MLIYLRFEVFIAWNTIDRIYSDGVTRKSEAEYYAKNRRRKTIFQKYLIK